MKGPRRHSGRPLDQRVDAVADAVCEERHPAGVVEVGDPVPQRPIVGRHVDLPALVALGDRLRGYAVLQMVG